MYRIVTIAALGATAPTAAFAAAKPKKAPVSKPVKAAKPVKPSPGRFTAVGTVAAVDTAARTVTVTATGGTPGVKGTTVTVAVPATAKVTVDDVKASLELVDAGDAVTVNGLRAGATLTATHVNGTTVEDAGPVG